MKAWNNIEKGMKKTVDGSNVTPPPFVWDNIEQELSAKPVKTGFLGMFKGLNLILVVLGLAVAGVGIGYLNVAGDDTGIASELNVPQSKIQLETVAEQELNPVVDEDLSDKEEVINNEEIQAVKSIASANVDSKTKLNRERKKDINTAQTTLSNNTNTRSIQSNSSAINSGFNQKVAQDIYQEIPVRYAAGSTTTQAQGLGLNTASHSAKAALRETISAIDLLGLEIAELKNERIVVLKNNDVKCPSFGAAPMEIHPFIEFNGLIGRHFKSIAGESAHWEARNNSESSWYTWGGNVNVGININRNFYLGSGIEWSQSKDKFYYGEEALIKMVITFDDTSGLPIDTSFIDGALVNKGEIRYTAIDVPLYLGALKNMGKWEIGLEAGVLFNLSFKAEGKMFNDQLDISRVENEVEIYKSKVGLGMRSSIVLRRYFKDGMSFQIKPGFKTYFGEVSHNNNLLDTKMRFARIELGLRKDF